MNHMDGSLMVSGAGIQPSKTSLETRLEPRPYIRFTLNHLFQDRSDSNPYLIADRRIPVVNKSLMTQLTLISPPLTSYRMTHPRNARIPVHAAGNSPDPPNQPNHLEVS